MDRINKALAKLVPKERELIKFLLLRLQNGDWAGLDIRKLKGRKDIFRIRKGKIRLIYRLFKGKVFILAIERRTEKTYKKY